MQTKKPNSSRGYTLILEFAGTTNNNLIGVGIITAHRTIAGSIIAPTAYISFSSFTIMFKYPHEKSMCIIQKHMLFS